MPLRCEIFNCDIGNGSKRQSSYSPFGLLSLVRTSRRVRESVDWMRQLGHLLIAAMIWGNSMAAAA